MTRTLKARKPGGALRLRIGVVTALALLAALVAGPAGSSSATPLAAGENAVTHWSGVAEGAIAAGRPPGSSSVLAGMVHGAMYDAVAAVEGGLVPFATAVASPAGASADAAVAEAARVVLVARVPAQAATVQAAYDAYMLTIPDGSAKDAGKAAGAAAAAGMLARRAGDGFDNTVPYVQRTPGPGVFEPIAPTTPADVKLGQVRPFTYDSSSAFRPGPPLALTTKRYGRDVNEVQAYGGAASTVRTPAQTETARFFADQTFVQYSRALRGLAEARGLDLRESARLLGYAHVAIADTMIACWEAKYYYSFWRPNHAIQRADTDGNPATSPEAGWLPLMVGNHPEYPSGHACFTAAVTESLRWYFGTKQVGLAVTSITTGTTRSYASLGDLVADVEDARVWGGLHFRTTMTDSAAHFPRIARGIGRDHFLLPVKPGAKATLPTLGPAVPAAIAVPAGHKAYLDGHAVGVQIYRCNAVADGYRWDFVAPRANLYGANGKLLTTHYAGPTWEAKDGSTVVGSVVDRANVDATAIPWLLLKAVSTAAGPDGDRLTATTYIQRIATTGGLAPAASTCDAGTAGEIAEVPYTADYVFWKKTFSAS
jgi:hypothetical protein